MSNKDIFPIDADATEARLLAHTDAQTGGELLSIVAGYLRRREPLPPDVADFLADAFEITALKPSQHQAAALARELGLTTLNRRPVAAPAWEVTQYIDDIATGPTERQRIIKAMQQFDISETTARRLLKQGRAALNEVSTLNHQ